MRSLGAVVARAEAERVRRALSDSGVLRGELVVARDGDEVIFPVSGPPIDPVPGARFEEREFVERTPAAPSSYRDLAQVPEELRDSLPRSFDVIGDIVLVRIPDELLPHSVAIGAALLEFVPGARLVGRDGGVHGESRLRQLERLAGSGGWTTVHRENGVHLETDLERAYFSPRLAREHARVAEEVRSGERVIDFACGIAPFGAHIVRDGRARELVAVDSNPAATELAQRNLARAGPARPWRVLTDSIERFAPVAGTCERAILNLPHGGVKYLPSVGATLEREGTLHYYERTERSRLRNRPGELVQTVGTIVPGTWSVPEVHVVHPYSPTEDIVAYRIVRG
ncbi:MAG: methyltransferase [Thermoplasmata archaeon]|nr:methyltransferase [Thermoplasmata archaeon]